MYSLKNVYTRIKEKKIPNTPEGSLVAFPINNQLPSPPTP